MDFPGMMTHAPGYASARYVHPMEPSGREVFVRSTQVASGDPEWLQGATVYPTIASVLNHCRSGYHDVVHVLPGHVETISTADHWANLVAGTRIVGHGYGTLRPTITWSAAAATVLLNVANVSIENMILEMAGDPDATTALTVAAPITVSAAGCRIAGCQVNFGVDADQLVTIGITTTAAADDFDFIGNHCYGATAAECTTFMDIIGCDRLRMIGNYIQGATDNVAVGIVRFATTASLNIRSEHNYFGNLKALSTCAVTGLAAVSGVSMHDHFHYLDAFSLTPWLTSTGIMSFHRPTVSNTAGETGSEVVGTVSA